MNPLNALAEACRQVGDAEHRVAEQRHQVESMRREGHDTRKAEALLVSFEKNLGTMREHFELERREAIRSHSAEA
jgi:hypothetical protein